jgi:hypothetical protein
MTRYVKGLDVESIPNSLIGYALGRFGFIQKVHVSDGQRYNIDRKRVLTLLNESLKTPKTSNERSPSNWNATPPTGSGSEEMLETETEKAVVETSVISGSDCGATGHSSGDICSVALEFLSSRHSP